MADETPTDRADILHAIGKKMAKDMEEYPQFKGSYLLLITVTPVDDGIPGDVMNITSNLPDDSIQRVLTYALETTMRQAPINYPKPT